MDLQKLLIQSVETLHLELSAKAAQKLIDYLHLLTKWNQTYNLTAIREPQKMVSHHLLDCLAIVPHLPAQTTHLIDIGTGAGLPGLIIAIMLPHCQVDLCESNHKKVAFLRQAIIELDLKNVAVYHERVEKIEVTTPYDIIISRAFSDMAEFVRLAQALATEKTQFYAMKGLYPYEEIAQLPPFVQLHEVLKISVPTLDAERHLVKLKRASV